MIYCGNEGIGKRMLAEALQSDPDLKDAQRAIKAIKVAATKKEEASQVFQANKLDEAIQKFDECLAVDPLNLTYNATILLNKSIALTKQSKNEEALACLNKSIAMKPDYAKALVKRGEVKQALEDYEDAVKDFSAASQIDQTGFGVQQKLQQAQQ